MSKAQLDKFISVLSSDPAVLQQATQGEEDLQQCARNVVQYAAAQGYDFTAEEARAWLAEQSQQLAGGELKESQLDAVAGGIVVIGTRGTRAGSTAVSSSAINAGWGAPPDDNKTGWGSPPDDGKTV